MQELINERRYAAIDLKSFYASVECAKRCLDPLDTNLVVADESRTEKTICLAVSPTLKQYGLLSRPRLFEVIQKVKEINEKRLFEYRKISGNHGAEFTGKSYFNHELEKDKSLELSYIAAAPRMAHYMAYSSRIYKIYLKYVAHEDIFAYSVDEVFIDLTPYLNIYNMTARELTVTMIKDVFASTGITAAAGIGTNMYLCKIAMDIIAKKMPADESGVRIAELDEMSYRRQLWTHRPITDFWHVGSGYAKKLERYGIHTMGDIARCSLGVESSCLNEDLLYKLFGVNAELLIDHAWGWEPCTIEEVKKYCPNTKSISSGQVLQHPYDFDNARLIVREMADSLSISLAHKSAAADKLVLTVGYDAQNSEEGQKRGFTVDRYGRKVPKHSHGTATLGNHTASTDKIVNTAIELFDSITDKKLLIRRITIAADNVIYKNSISHDTVEQLDLFSGELQQEEKISDKKKNEESIQCAILKIKTKYGSNAVIRGMNLRKGATGIGRNKQIGGHRA